MIELQNFLVILILLIIFIVFIRIYMEITNHIGEGIRMFFAKIWQSLKRLME